MAKAKTIEDRLAALVEGREQAVDVPVTGRETARAARMSAGMDGRAERVRAMRDRVALVTPYEAASAPFEHLIFTNRLVESEDAREMAWLRAEAGFRFRQDRELEQVTTLGSKSLEMTGGGGSRGQLADVKLHAMQSVGRLKDAMPVARFRILEAIVFDDVWVYETKAPARFRSAKAKRAWEQRAAQHRTATVREFLCALDTAAVHYDLLRYPVFKDRWPAAEYAPRRARVY